MKYGKMIIHSAAFKLKVAKGTQEEAEFMNKAWDMLSVIPGVIDFKLMTIINESNPYDYEIEMKFESEELLRTYQAHPNHWDKENNKGFVVEVWQQYVDTFLEKDTIVLREE